LTGITNKSTGGATASSFSYAYNTDGKKISATELDGSVLSWTYNNAGRLIGESRSGSSAYSASYTMDGEGRRTSQTISGVTTSFTFDGDDALTSTSGGFANTYGYNTNGEQTSRTLGGVTSTLSWNAKGELASIVTGGNTVSFGYDALGRRVTRTAGGITTRFVRAGDTNGGSVLLEKQGAAVTKSYLYGAGGIVRSGSEWLGSDALGSARTVWNASGSAVGSQMLDAFGNAKSSSGTGSGSYGFAATSGYRSDGDAGLMHVGARYYDAQVGQFLSRDTYLDQKSYNYCEGDPINYVDLSGHDPIPPWQVPWRGLWDTFWSGLTGGLATLIGGGLGGVGGGLAGGVVGGPLGFLLGDLLWYGGGALVDLYKNDSQDPKNNVQYLQKKNYEEYLHAYSKN
jgi:RHS repeat-associated protein